MEGHGVLELMVQGVQPRLQYSTRLQPNAVLSVKTASWVPLVHVQKSPPWFNSFCVGGFTMTWRIKRLEIATYTQKPSDRCKQSRFMHTTKLDALTKSPWKCRPNKYEVKYMYGSCVCRVTQHAKKSVRYSSLDSMSVLFWSCDSLTVLYWSCDSPQVCCIGHVSRKSMLYGEYETGGTFDPPT